MVPDAMPMYRSAPETSWKWKQQERQHEELMQPCAAKSIEGRLVTNVL
jgi:hypothetical protein